VARGLARWDWTWWMGGVEAGGVSVEFGFGGGGEGDEMR